MNLAHQSGDRRGGAGITHAPARHGERLGKAVEGHGALEHAGDGGEGDVLPPAVGQFGVDLVRNHQDIRIFEHLGERFKIRPLHDAAGGVVGIGQDQRLGAGRDARLQLLRKQFEAVIRAGGDAHRHAARKVHAGRIGNIGRIGNEHLIARLQHRAQRKVDALGCADGDDDFIVRVIIDAATDVQIVRDFTAEIQVAPVGGIVRPPLLDGVDGRFADVPGRDKIRLAYAQRDRVLHGADDIEELADAAGGDFLHGAVEELFVIHGDTASLLSVWFSSRITPSNLYFFSTKCVAVDITPSMVASFCDTKDASVRMVAA